MATMWTSVGPDTAVGRPTRQQSIQFGGCPPPASPPPALMYSSPGMSLLGCTAFAALAGYVAFFHASRYLALVLATAAATSVVCAVEMAIAEGALVALAKLLIIAAGVLSVPFFVHVLVHLLGDAEVTHRSTHRAAQSARLLPFGAPTHQCVRGSGGAVPLGDHRRSRPLQAGQRHAGHATGDRILVAVADKLRHTPVGAPLPHGSAVRSS
jgi:hypothetical protein